MEPLFKETVAAIMVGVFGLFLIWQGMFGTGIRTGTNAPLFPKWMYILSGISVLILPVAYLIARLAM